MFTTMYVNYVNFPLKYNLLNVHKDNLYPQGFHLLLLGGTESIAITLNFGLRIFNRNIR